MDLEPWSNPDAIRWLANMRSWPKMVKMIQTTLRQDPRKYPHQIRAAAALVILIAREGLWPETAMGIYDVAALARRQLAQIRQAISVRTRSNREVVKDRAYRQLLNSLDQELRILEARGAEEESKLPEEPPSSWGNFWYE